MGNSMKRGSSNRAGKFWISMVLVVFVVVMSVQISKVYRKDLEYISRQEALEQQLADEIERQEEVEDYRRYTNSREYTEDVAKSKLGLLYKNEIVFREQK